MTKDKAMKLALEALEVAQNNLAPSRGSARAYGDGELWDRYETAITAIKQAFAAQPAPVQEHVASAAYDMIDRFLRNNLSSDDDYAEYSAALDALYTTSPAANPAQGQEPVAKAWDEGYRAGVNDERMSEANIGIAGFDAKVEPARYNPYRTNPTAAQRQWVGLTGQQKNLIARISVDVFDAIHRAEAKLRSKNT